MRRSNLRQHSEEKNEQGFSLIQMVIAVAIIAVVTTFGILGITKARAQMRLQNSARRFAVLIEKARADSIRRHVPAGAESWVRSSEAGSNTYQVSMDFDGNGTVQTRTFMLDPDCVFNTDSQTAAFDWRGRVPQRLVFQIRNGSLDPIPVDVSGSGDVTVDQQAFEDDNIPDVSPTPVTGDVVPDPTPLPTATPTPTSTPSASPSPSPTATATPNGNGNGNGNGNNPSPTPTPSPTATPTPTPTPYPSPSPSPAPIGQCTASVSPSSLTLSQTIDGSRTGTVVFTLQEATGTHTVSAAIAGNGSSLSLSVSPSTISGSGSAIVTIGSKTGAGNRGTFSVTIQASPTCGSAQTVTVTVNN